MKRFDPMFLFTLFGTVWNAYFVIWNVVAATDGNWWFHFAFAVIHLAALALHIAVYDRHLIAKSRRGGR